MALSCRAVGFFAPVAACAGAGDEGALVCVGFGALSVFVDGEAGREISGEGSAVVVGFSAAGRVSIILRQAGDNSAAFAFRQSSNSGLLGAIQEQCAAKSLSVQVCRTSLS